MTENMKIIVHEGKPERQEENRIRRAAAYCRVSTLAEVQALSYESQCAYFTELIENQNNMELVWIFGDYGISGLSTDRPQLQALMKLVREDQIDLIFVKSISRMARNMMDFEKILDEIKVHHAVVVFEREGICSDDPRCEMAVKLMAAIAQEESNSLSRNITIAQDHCNKLGKPTRRCPYGFRKCPRKKGEPHVWEICEAEAELVRLAFNLAKAGTGLSEIAEVLNRVQKKYPDAKQRRWSSAAVAHMLSNEAYIGDILTNKTFTVDYLTKIRKINEGERARYYLEDHHPAIVSRKLFAAINDGAGIVGNNGEIG